MTSDNIISGQFPARLLLAAVLFVAGASFVRADWEDYKPDTLAAAVAKYAGFGNETNDATTKERYELFPGVPLRVDIVFTGRTRALPDGRRQTIERWAKSFHADIAVVRTIEREIEVREAGETFWLPIQDVLIPYLQDEVGSGGRATLFVRLIGARNKDFVFIVNEFDPL